MDILPFLKCSSGHLLLLLEIQLQLFVETNLPHHLWLPHWFKTDSPVNWPLNPRWFKTDSPRQIPAESPLIQNGHPSQIPAESMLIHTWLSRCCVPGAGCSGRDYTQGEGATEGQAAASHHLPAPEQVQGENTRKWRPGIRVLITTQCLVFHQTLVDIVIMKCI